MPRLIEYKEPVTSYKAETGDALQHVYVCPQEISNVCVVPCDFDNF